jgi:hypothetical protein
MRRKLVGVGIVAALALALPVTAIGGTGIVAKMDGEQIVNPDGGDPDGTAKLKLKVNRVKARVCYDLQTDKLDKVTGAFIHKGEAGDVGRPIITLFEGELEETGCVHGLKQRLVKRLKRKPGEHYADVTTKAYPEGAVRGQLG